MADAAVAASVLSSFNFLHKASIGVDEVGNRFGQRSLVATSSATSTISVTAAMAELSKHPTQFVHGDSGGMLMASQWVSTFLGKG